MVEIMGCIYRGLLVMVSLLLGGAGPSVVMAQRPLAGQRPNIIVILTDDQGYGDMSCHGNPILRTPNIDKLHAEGARFVDFHVSPTCSPSRAALMTGAHEFRSGVTHTIEERERMAPSMVTLAEVLRAAGYATGIFGKWHLGDEPERWPSQRGFDEVCIHGAGGIGQSYPGSCGDVPGNMYTNPTLLKNGRFVRTKGYCTDVFFAEAMQWMEGVKEKRPFFTWIATNAPHEPLQVRPEDEALYTDKVADVRVAKFFGMIANLDAAVGRLLAQLEAWGETRETLVIFMNDNGGMTGLPVWAAGMRGGKTSPYLGGTRVASFWRWPGTIPSGDRTGMAAHIDVLPTLLEISGGAKTGALDAQIEGRSLCPLLQEAQATWPERLLYTHNGRWPRGAAREDWRYKGCGILSPQWHLVSVRGGQTPQWELYDRRQDPGELRDVAATEPQIVQRLASGYDEWWQRAQPWMVNEGAPLAKENAFKLWAAEHPPQ